MGIFSIYAFFVVWLTLLLFAGEASLKQIYCTFNRALLRLIPPLRTYADPLTNAMVEFFLKSQERFTQDMQPHYVYSPREMTRQEI